MGEVQVQVTPSQPQNLQVGIKNVKNSVQIEENPSHYYSTLAKLWATNMDGLVQNEDYSSKYWAKNAQSSAEVSQAAAESAANLSDLINNNYNAYSQELNEITVTGKENIEATGEKTLQDIADAKNEALAEISEAGEGVSIDEFKELESKVDLKQDILLPGKNITIEGNLIDTVGLANADLSNLTETGEKHFLNKTQLTNCVLEIPQRVNLQDNGTNIIIKAGTIGIQPNGFEADGTTPKFDYITVTADITLNNDQSKTVLLGLNGTTGVYRTPNSAIFSGPTAPASPVNLTIWYDTSTNLVKRYVNSAWEVAQYTFPLGILKYTASGKPGSIEQVFNGYGFIGQCTWVDKGVKVLFADGRNDDGTLKNKEFTSQNVNINNLEGQISQLSQFKLDNNILRLYGYGPLNYFEQNDEPTGFVTFAIWYNTSENQVYETSDNGATWEKVYTIMLSWMQKASVDDSISNIQMQNAFKIANAADVDGRWAYKNLALCNQQMTTVLNVETDLEFDLSSYLPDDGQRYEIIVNGYIFCGPTLGSSLAVSARNSQGYVNNICGIRNSVQQSTITNSALSQGSALMVIEADKKLTLRYYATGSNGQLRNFNIKGYRKVR